MFFLRLDIKTSRSDEWQQVNLGSGKELSISETSPLWNTTTNGVFSYPFTIDIDKNLHIFGTSAALNGSMIRDLIDKAKCRLYTNGNILHSGIIKTDDIVEVKFEDGQRTIDVNFETGRDGLEDTLNNVQIRDLDFLQYKIQIGYTLPEELPFHGSYNMTKYGYPYPSEVDGANPLVQSSNQLVPRGYETINYTRSVTLPKILVVDYHDSLYNGEYTHDFSNVQSPYNPYNPTEHPYCNVRAAYQKYKWDSGNSSWVAERTTRAGEPNRVNSAPCFYFGFVHDEMFKQLGINIKENALNNLLDYCRLAFWNTRPEFETEVVEGKNFDNNNADNRIKINAVYASGRQYVGYYSRADQYQDWARKYTLARSITTEMQLCRAYATAKNLPDIGAQEIVDATKAAFGARYFYDAETNTLEIKLVREILASKEIKEIPSLRITGDLTKTEDSVKGIRFKYSASNEASKNTITKKENLVEGSDETTYNYNDYRFPYILGEGEAFSALREDGTATLATSFGLGTPIYSYQDLIKNITDSDLHVYIDPNTSNAYRIKVDSDATTQAEWFPSLFQVAAFRDVVLGDVSDESDPEEIIIPFAPVIPTDTNFYEEFKAANASGVVTEDENGEIVESEDDEAQTPSPIYGQLIEGEIHRHDDDGLIRHRYMHNAITVATLYDHGTNKTNICCHIDVAVDIESVEEYTVDNNSDGPYYDNEPTFTLGIMRGSGASAQTVIYDDNYDGEGHALYMDTNGTDAEFTSDTMDTYGNMYDYNGGGETTVTPEQAKSYIIANYSKSNVNLIPPASDTIVGTSGSYSDRLLYLNNAMLSFQSLDIVTNEGTTRKWVIINMLGKRFWHKYGTIVQDKETLTDYDVSTDEGSEGLAAASHAYSTAKLADYGTNGGSSEDSIMSYDAANEKFLVAIYDTYTAMTSSYNFLLDLGDALTGEDDTVTFPDNGLGYDFKDLISLRLKAELPIDGIASRGYYPVSNPLARNRGLADKFYGTYFHWLLNRKMVKIPCTMSDEDLKSLDFFTRYRFGDIVGFINKINYNINDGGIYNIVLEVYYL